MPLDFTKPATTGNYSTGVLQPIVDAQKALAQWLDPTAAGTLTSIPTGAMRRVESTTAVERHNGTSWVQSIINGLSFSGGNPYIPNTLLIGSVTASTAKLAATAAGTAGAATAVAVFGTVASGTAGTETRVHFNAGEGLTRGAYISAVNTNGAGNAHDLIFATGASASAPVERARFTNFGLNIGNTDGATPLEVTSNSVARGITVRGRSADGISGLEFYNNAGTTRYAAIQGRSTDLRVSTDSVMMTWYPAGTLGMILSPTADLDVRGEVKGVTLTTSSLTSTIGYATIQQGLAGRTGYLEFYALNGNRQGYIGYSPSTGATDSGVVNYVAGTHNFNSTIRLGGGSGSLRVGASDLITRFESAEQTVPSTLNVMTVAHGGTRVPDLFQAFLRCKTAEHGYSVGAEVLIKDDMGDTNRGHQFEANATNVVWRYLTGGGATVPSVRNASNAVVGVTPANWRVVFKAHWL